MRRLTCACGGEVPRPLPTNCPHCGRRITRVRRKADWIGPLVVVLLFAALIVLLIWLTWGASDTRRRPFGAAGRGAGIKDEAPNPKRQIRNKHEIQSTNDRNGVPRAASFLSF